MPRLRGMKTPLDKETERIKSLKDEAFLKEIVSLAANWVEEHETDLPYDQLAALYMDRLQTILR